MAEHLQRDIKASGVRLRVEEAGQGQAIVLLHSLFFVRSTWDGIVSRLSDEFRVIAPDLPGFGESEKPLTTRFDYTTRAFAHAITDLYAGLRLGRATIVGHGHGGAIAVALAARHPELVSRLVLVDCLCFDAPFQLTERMARLPLVGGFAFKQLFGRSAFRSYFRDRMFGPDVTAPLARIDEYYRAFNPPAARASALATLRATVDTRSIIADTARVTAPTLVIWGRDDALYPASLGQRLAKNIRSAGLELMNTGHSPHEEQPEAFAQIVAKFCRAERAGT